MKKRRGREAVSVLVGALHALGVDAGAVSGVDVPVSAVQLGEHAIELPRYRTSDVDMRIDGRLDEPVWSELPAYDPFVVIEPDKLTRGAHATVVKLFYTDQGIYAGFDLEQPVETLTSWLSSRDQRELNRDAVSLTLDTSGTGRYGYWFGVNLGDSLMDGTVLPERQFRTDWDGYWRGASAVTEEGWSAEMFLPWSMVSMPHGGGARRMGLYISRKVAYLDERWGWPALPETKPKFMSALQRLELEGVDPRQQYSVFPYVSGTVDGVDDELTYKTGGDVFWRPSTNFQLTAALNPDFGNVETDEVIVNLTAFETFFPEKRLFFLEGQEIFTTTPRADSRLNREPTTVVNTRRIGGTPREPALPPGTSLRRAELEQPAELFGAAKATGQFGSLRYGVLGAAEKETKFDAEIDGADANLHQEGSDYGIARLLYEDNVGGAYRALGWISTAAMHPEEDAYVQGLDVHYLSPLGTWKWDTQLLYSDLTESRNGRGAFTDIVYTPAQGVSHQLGLDFFDRNLDINDLGFLRRNDVIGGRYRFNMRTTELTWARDWNLIVMLSEEWNNDGEVTRSGLFVEQEFLLEDLSRVFTGVSFFPPRSEDRNSFGNGTYRIEERRNAFLGYESDSSRAFTFGAELEYMEEELSGPGYYGATWFAWHPSPRFTFDSELRLRRRDGWLLHQEGRNMTTFRADELGTVVNFDFFFTARQQLRASLQWVGIRADEDEFFLIPSDVGDLVPVAKPPGPSDDFSLSLLSFQVRYRWEIAPLSDLFVVYTRTSNLPRRVTPSFGDLFADAFDEPDTDQLIVKLRYRFGT